MVLFNPMQKEKKKKATKSKKKTSTIEFYFTVCSTRSSLTMKDLPERSNRGPRRKVLQGAAMEADMNFWNQDYFKEVSDDDDFTDSHCESSAVRLCVASDTLSDSEDSDIDIPEDEDEQPLVVERPEKKVVSSRLDSLE